MSDMKAAMPEQRDLDQALARVMAEANHIFERMGGLVEEAAKTGVTHLDVVDISQRSGLPIDEKVLADLQVDRLIPVQRWLPWHQWWSYRPLWCWWWHRYYPWYRCCPWWWHRCHWYPW